MKLYILGGILFLLVTSSPADAADVEYNPYIGITLGSPLTSINKLSDSSGSIDASFYPGYTGSVSAGIAFDKIRTELELGYRKNELKKVSGLGQDLKLNGNNTLVDYMANIYIESPSDIVPNETVHAFITAGIGAATASISNISSKTTQLVKSGQNTQFAYQGGVGISYDITPHVVFDTSYKYLGTSDLVFHGVTAKYSSHNVLFGLRFKYY